MGLKVHNNTTLSALSSSSQFPVESRPHGCFEYSLLFVVPLDRSKEWNTADLCTAMRHCCHSISVNKATLLPHHHGTIQWNLTEEEKSQVWVEGRSCCCHHRCCCGKQGLWYYGDTKDHRVRSHAKVCASFEEIEATTHWWREYLKVGSRVKTDSV